MWIVRLALRRPYTFVVLALLIAVLGVAAITTMSVDIFPAIDIPVVNVVWNYGGLTPTEVQDRIVNVGEMPCSSSHVRLPAQSPNAWPWGRTSRKGVSASVRVPGGACGGCAASSAWAAAAQPRITIDDENDSTST